MGLKLGETDHAKIFIRPFTGTLKMEFIDDIVEDWTIDALCHGRWDEFDDGKSYQTARECVSCPVRRECLLSALRYEREVGAHTPVDDMPKGGNIKRYGIRGGYLPREREHIDAIIDIEGWHYLEKFL